MSCCNRWHAGIRCPGLSDASAACELTQGLCREHLWISASTFRAGHRCMPPPTPRGAKYCLSWSTTVPTSKAATMPVRFVVLPQASMLQMQKGQSLAV